MKPPAGMTIGTALTGAEAPGQEVTVLIDVTVQDVAKRYDRWGRAVITGRMADNRTLTYVPDPRRWPAPARYFTRALTGRWAWPV